MDYVRQELLRQRWLLTALLGIGATKEQEEQGGRTETVAAETNASTAVGRVPAGTESTAVRMAEALTPVAEEGGQAGFDGEEETRGLRWFVGQGGRGRRSAFPADHAADVEERAGWSGGTSAETGGFAWPGRWTDAGGGADAEAVSRAIQRDARRYDGGFFMF